MDRREKESMKRIDDIRTDSNRVIKKFDELNKEVD